MTDPVRCSPQPLPVRPETLDADSIVTLAAGLARVEDRCDPVHTPGPSYEEVKRAQARAVGEPVEALVRKFESTTPDVWISAVLVLSGGAKRAMGVAVMVERMLDSIWANAVAEGQELERARVRDAKVAAILNLGASALSPGFLAAELKERSRSLGEAALVLARIDARPGLREALSAEIARAIGEGRAFVAVEGIRSHAGLEAFIAAARGLGERAEAGQALTLRDSQILHAVDRLRTDTAFRLGVEAELSSPAPPR
jgi:hypothetical protein